MKRSGIIMRGGVKMPGIREPRVVSSIPAPPVGSGMGRRPINRVSKRRQRVNRERAKAQEAAWGPRPWECRFMYYAAEGVIDHGFTYDDFADAGMCYGGVNGHEILSRAQSRTDANLVDVSGQVPLCAHHNEWVDTHHAEAERLGLWRPWTAEDK